LNVVLDPGAVKYNIVGAFGPTCSVYVVQALPFHCSTAFKSVLKRICPTVGEPGRWEVFPDDIFKCWALLKYVRLPNVAIIFYLY
jgi:hypothetical protein